MDAISITDGVLKTLLGLDLGAPDAPSLLAISLVAAASALLVFLLLAWSRATSPRGDGAPPCESPLAPEPRCDSAMNKLLGSQKAPPGTSLEAAAASTGTPIAVSSSGSSTSRRRLSRSQRHDSSTSVDTVASMARRTVSSTTTTNRPSLAEEAPQLHLGSQRLVSIGNSTSTGQPRLLPPHSELQDTTDPDSSTSYHSPKHADRPQQISSAADAGAPTDQGQPSMPQPPPTAWFVSAPAGQLLLPSRLLAPPDSPLQAVSAPLTGYAMMSTASNSSSHSLDECTTVQSLSDPSTSISQPPSTNISKPPSTSIGQPLSQTSNQPPSRSSQRPAAAPPAAAPAPTALALDAVSAALAKPPAGAQATATPAAAAAARPSSSVQSPPPGPQESHARPMGTCLPAAPWPSPTGTAPRTLYGAAPAAAVAAPPAPAEAAAAAPAAATVQPLVPSTVLYRSPLQHVTLSVKVPTEYSHQSSSHLQSLVARQVWAAQSRQAAAAAAGPAPLGTALGLSDPHHTVLHMVAIPGCIQLMISVAAAPAATHGSRSSAGADIQGSTGAVQVVGGSAAAGQAEAARQPADAASRQQTQAQTQCMAHTGAPDTTHACTYVDDTGAPAAGPAPAWLVEAVCAAVEQFMRAQQQPEAQGTDHTGVLSGAGSSSSSGRTSPGAGQRIGTTAATAEAAAAAADDEQQQEQAHYTGPVLVGFDGRLYTLKPGVDAAAAWVLQQCGPQAQQHLQSELQPTSASVPADLSGSLGAVAGQQRGSAQPSSTPDVADTPARTQTPAAAQAAAAKAAAFQSPDVAPVTAHSPATQQQQLLQALLPLPLHSPRRPSARASARTFIRTVARGVAAVHQQGAASALFAAAQSAPGTAAAHPHPFAANASPAAAGGVQLTADGLDAAATPSVSVAAAPGGGDHQGGAADGAGRQHVLPSGLPLGTSCALGTALPAGMWSWPLYVATCSSPEAAAAGADARVAVCGSSAAVPMVSLSGLPEGTSSCRVVLASSGGAVLMDCRLPVRKGVARFLAPQSAVVQSSKVYFLLPPTPAAAPASHRQQAMAAGPASSAKLNSAPGDSSTAAAAAGVAAAAAAGAAPAAWPSSCDQLLCMLPLLHLPTDAVTELCEAARSIMLERSYALFMQHLQQQELEGQQWAAATAAAAGQTADAGESYTGSLSWPAAGGSGARFMGSFSAPAAAVAAGTHSSNVLPGARPTPAAAAAAAACRSVGDADEAHSSRASVILLGTPTQQLQALKGESSHEGSFDTTPSTSRRQPSRKHCLPLQLPDAPVPVPQPAAVNAAATAAQEDAAGATVTHLPQLPHHNGNSGDGSSGSSSVYAARTGLEDEPGQLNLRGRLFEGATDVHDLLNSQYLAVLADLGLLIELAASNTAAAAAGAAAAGTEQVGSSHRSSSSSSSEGASVTEVSPHAGMAAELGQQLLVWFADNRCWCCCQLVLQLLLQIGVRLHLHGRCVTAASCASVQAVQELLQGPAGSLSSGAFDGAEAVGHGVAGAHSAISVSAPTASGRGVGRAGVWGHASSQPSIAAAPAAPAAPAAAVAAAQASEGPPSTASSDNTSYDSCSSVLLWTATVAAAAEVRVVHKAAAAGLRDTQRPPDSAPAAAKATHAAAAPAPAAAGAAPGAGPALQPQPLQQQAAAHGGTALHSRGSILDSASDMWTRLRRRRHTGKGSASG